VADQRTVRAAQAGDLEAREELARASQRAAYLFALHLTGHREDALELAQDAMLRLFGSLARFDARRPLRPWLLRIVRNLARDRARRLKVRRTEPLEREGDLVRVEPTDTSPNPEQLATHNELRRVLWRAVGQLPARYREVVALRDYMDLTYAEIAQTLKIPTGTVMSRLHRGRTLLRRSIRRSLTEEARHD
jgi:RNA polymerase sigma-70 factor (ECF subfamily)